MQTLHLLLIFKPCLSSLLYLLSSYSVRVHLLPDLIFLRILNLPLQTSLIPALLPCILFNVTLSSPSLFYPPAWILQASHLLSDNAKAPGGENSQGWALSVQSGISAWGATEKVLDHQLDRDAALLLLRPLLWTMSRLPSRPFDTGQTENIGLGRAAWTNCGLCIHLIFIFFTSEDFNFFSAIYWTFQRL